MTDVKKFLSPEFFSRIPIDIQIRVLLEVKEHSLVPPAHLRSLGITFLKCLPVNRPNTRFDCLGSLYLSAWLLTYLKNAEYERSLREVTNIMCEDALRFAKAFPPVELAIVSNCLYRFNAKTGNEFCQVVASSLVHQIAEGPKKYEERHNLVTLVKFLRVQNYFSVKVHKALSEYILSDLNLAEYAHIMAWFSEISSPPPKIDVLKRKLLSLPPTYSSQETSQLHPSEAERLKHVSKIMWSSSKLFLKDFTDPKLLQVVKAFATAAMKSDVKSYIDVLQSLLILGGEITKAEVLNARSIIPKGHFKSTVKVALIEDVVQLNEGVSPAEEPAPVESLLRLLGKDDIAGDDIHFPVVFPIKSLRIPSLKVGQKYVDILGGENVLRNGQPVGLFRLKQNVMKNMGRDVVVFDPSKDDCSLLEFLAKCK